MLEVNKRKNYTSSEVLQYIRANRGLSIRELAKLCGYSPAYICEIENYKRKLNKEFTKSLCIAIDLSDQEKDLLIKACKKDNFEVPFEVTNYLIDNDLIEDIQVIMNLDEKGKSIKLLAKELNTKTKR